MITRTWNKGDKIDLDLPMKIQRVKASDKITANRGKVALRYGPLVYNIERVDQDITKALSPAAPLTTEWKPDLLGGVLVIKGQFTDGSSMTAIPNFARTNRDPAPPPTVPGQRLNPVRRPPSSGLTKADEECSVLLRRRCASVRLNCVAVGLTNEWITVPLKSGPIRHETTGSY